jgi:AraC family transcriptional activator of pobA
MTGAIPTFYLYGEPKRAVDHGFIHVEDLDDRSRPNEWTILPHAHADLHQIFLATEGGGALRVEDTSHAFTAPALMVVPATMVHSFAWHRESAGAVLTLSCTYNDELTRRGLGVAPLFDTFRLVETDEATARTAAATMMLLLRELGWSAPGQRAAVEAALLALLVTALRTFRPGDARGTPAPRSSVALVARYRARIEARFRRRERVAAHAAALGVSESRLRAACAAVAGLSPAAMLDQRTMLEARRRLLYSTLTVAEIGYSLGFTDPAYFSRFFTVQAGVSPKAFRQQQPLSHYRSPD